MNCPIIKWQEGGSDIELAMIGGICVGRIYRGNQGRKPSWMSHMPTKTGTTFCIWRDEKTIAAAKNSLLAAIRDWLRIANLTTERGELI